MSSIYYYKTKFVFEDVIMLHKKIMSTKSIRKLKPQKGFLEKLSAEIEIQQALKSEGSKQTDNQLK